jgi:hypothetical protein
VWITVILKGVNENFIIHSADSVLSDNVCISLGLDIETPQLSACNTKVELKDRMEFKYLFKFILPF